MGKYTESKVYNDYNKSVAKLRFLPNIIQDDYLPTSELISNFSIYNILVKIEDISKEVDGIYSYPSKLGLDNFYSYLLNINNDISLLDKVSTVNKYYSYVLVLEDTSNPELEGKVMIFEYDEDIYNMIQSYHTKKKITVFDFIEGLEFTYSTRRKKKKLVFDQKPSSIFHLENLNTEDELMKLIYSRDLNLEDIKFNKKELSLKDITNALKNIDN